MHNQESLFDLPPKENKNQIEKTDIEYIQLHFLNTEKKELIKMMEHLLSYYKLNNYPELLLKLTKEKYEKINPSI